MAPSPERESTRSPADPGLPAPHDAVGGPYTGPERRADDRHAAAAGTTAFLLTDAGGAPWEAVVTDVSAGGVGLVVGDALEPGRLVIITLCHPAGGVDVQSLARVVWMRQRPTGAYHLGCAFLQPLTASQLDGLR